jgi:hypothetical protein
MTTYEYADDSVQRKFKEQCLALLDRVAAGGGNNGSYSR